MSEIDINRTDLRIHQNNIHIVLPANAPDSVGRCSQSVEASATRLMEKIWWASTSAMRMMRTPSRMKTNDFFWIPNAYSEPHHKIIFECVSDNDYPISRNSAFLIRQCASTETRSQGLRVEIKLFSCCGRPMKQLLPIYLFTWAIHLGINKTRQKKNNNWFPDKACPAIVDSTPNRSYNQVLEPMPCRPDD